MASVGGPIGLAGSSTAETGSRASQRRMKPMPPAGQFLPDWQTRLFEAQPAPVRYSFIGVHSPDQTPSDRGGERDCLISDDHAGEHAAARLLDSLFTIVSAMFMRVQTRCESMEVRGDEAARGNRRV